MTELAKTYDPKIVEEKWYNFWESGKYFHAPDEPKAKAYCIVIPPPNVTGALHMGHALNNTLQDILIRWKRMQGLATLWQPGTDHAGIATQNVVEREILKTEKKRRHEIGRPALIARIWKWREQYGGRILDQLKAMGCSCDWERTRFTLDKGLANAVTECFVRLYDEGLIYRGKYIVNWCPRCHTALADDEVEHKDEKGHLWHIRYPMKGGKGCIVVATTRPETMLGDTAVAVNPKDKRYSALIGKMVHLPETGREIPIIADDFVDSAFGTGAVKVTPAHDPNDFQIGNRHNLPRINVMTGSATMSDEAGEKYAGMKAFDCRKKIIEALDAAGLLEKTEDHAHAVGHCYRCHATIEPWLSDQWFVKMRPLAEAAIRATEEGKIKFHPDRWETFYMQWLKNARDWCISRQIWWGHRIPVWYCKDEAGGTKQEAGSMKQEAGSMKQEAGSMKHEAGSMNHEAGSMKHEAGSMNHEAGSMNHEAGSMKHEAGSMNHEAGSAKQEAGSRKQKAGKCPPIVARGVPKKCPHCGGENLVQDEDVLDTWFSAWLWPFSTLGWPDRTPLLSAYYPTNTLVTDRGIIYFWVARMVMAGLHLTGDVPFADIYIHGTILDEQGRKMSKSLGNGIDPIDIIAKYGADAMRYSLVVLSTEGQDLKLSESKFEMGRNFCNKLWNAARFAMMSGDAGGGDADLSAASIADRWIISRLAATTNTVLEELGNFHFSTAAQALYRFVWNDFCDWYVEAAKIGLNSGDEKQKAAVQHTLKHVLSETLKLLHPFLPFITEEIWSHVNPGAEPLIISKYPKAGVIPYEQDAKNFEISVIEPVEAIRNIRGENNVPPGKKIPVALSGFADGSLLSTCPVGHVEHLARVDKFTVFEAGHEPPEILKSATFVAGHQTVYIPLAGLIDVEAETARLMKEIGRTENEIAIVEKKLANKLFTDNAPAEIVGKEREKLGQAKEKVAKLKDALKKVKEVG